MREIHWKQHNITSLGLFDISFPVCEIGNGKGSVLTLSAMVHGNERSGLLFIYYFLTEVVPHLGVIQGTLRVIPAVNPLAAITDTRESFIDRLDANRLGLGSPKQQLTEAILTAFSDIVLDSNLIINLHEFENDSPIICIFTNPNQPDISHVVLQHILSFSPEVIWSIPSNDNCLIANSLDSALNNRGAPTFSVEMPRSDLVTSREFFFVKDGVLRVMQELGMIENTDTQARSVPKAYFQSAVYSYEMGIWTPSVNKNSQVTSGQLIGTLATLPFFEERAFHTEDDVLILRIRPKEVVGPNSILYAVASPDDALNKKLQAMPSGVNS